MVLCKEPTNCLVSHISIITHPISEKETTLLDFPNGKLLQSFGDRSVVIPNGGMAYLLQQRNLDSIQLLNHCL